MMGKAVAWSVAVALAIVVAALTLYRQQRQDIALQAHLENVKQRGGEPEVSCAEVRASRPMVLLALGQSNAGNHGAAATLSLEPVTLVAGDRCILANDPLPGATGNGASIWRRLPAALSGLGVARPVVLDVLAVDGASIGAWTRRGSPLRRRLESTVESLRKTGLMPDFVLWQQGEADALDGIGRAGYVNALGELRSALDENGATAPILLAYSTTCRSVPNDAIRAAIEAAAADSARFRMGPDTDALQGPRYRYDGCHFTADGLNAAAKLWAESLTPQFVPPPIKAQ